MDSISYPHSITKSLQPLAIRTVTGNDYMNVVAKHLQQIRRPDGVAQSLA
jgi:ABC-type phosphate transport system auxiliary subunit